MMNKGLFSSLSVLLLILGVIGCKEIEVSSCTGTDYKIIIKRNILYVNSYGSSLSQNEVIIKTDDEEAFEENITVQLRIYDYEREFAKTLEIPVQQGEASGKLIHTSEEYGDRGGFSYSATITTANCPDPVEKTEEDIETASEELACDTSLVKINESRCDEQYTFTWEAGEGKDLDGVTLEVYGKSIDLSTGNSATFPLTALDTAKAGYISNNGDICYLPFNISDCENVEASGSTGKVSLTDPLTAGDTLTIRLTDADLNIDAESVETVSVVLTTSKDETEHVTLTETGKDTGVFSFKLATVLGADAGTDDDGTITIEKDIKVTVTYDDALDSEGNDPEAIMVAVTVTGDAAPTCSDGIQNGDETGVDCGGSCEACIVTGATGTLSLTDPLTAGDDLIVQLTDADLNTDAESVETVSVVLTTSKDETEHVTLTETGKDTGVFSFKLATVLGADAGTDDDGSITIEKDTKVTVTYDDALDAEGNDPEAIMVAVTVTGDAAPTCSDGIQNGDETGVDCGGSCEACADSGSTVTFNGSQYRIDNGSTFAYDAAGTNYLLLDMNEFVDDGAGGVKYGFAISLELYSNNTVESGTYQFNGAGSGFSNASQVSLNNGAVFYDATGGTVVLTIEGNNYTVEMDITTKGGNLKGTYIITGE